MSTNPFDSDCEIPASQSSRPIEKNKKLVKKVDRKTNKPASKKLTSPVVKSSFFESDVESDVDLSTPSTSGKKKRKLSDSEVEPELDGAPIRAAALRSYLSRRSGSGYTLQRDPTRQGNYYVELRVYDAREAEALHTDRWKRALVTFKSAVEDRSPVWKAVKKLVVEAKQDYRKIQPIFYPSNIF